MASHMTSQVGATKRNTQAELFVDQLLKMYCEQLKERGLIKNINVITQAPYKSEIASDIWDHKVTFHDNNIGKDIEFWCQTTCYKGHGDIKKREPNKSYEVKETLVEAISLRKLIEQENKIVRTIHFTVGDVNYTYGWFKSLKEKSFDLSIYLDTKETNIFNTLNASIGNSKIEFQIKKAILNLIDTNFEFKDLLSSSIKIINNWHINDLLPIQTAAQEQWNIVKRNKLEVPIKDIIHNSVKSGLDIKLQATLAIQKGSSNDDILEETVENLLSKKPALKKLYYAKNNWDDYSSTVRNICHKHDDLYGAIKNLWINTKLKEVYRRMLLRVHTNQGVDYIQDIDINGISEHNLYTGKHTEIQVKKLCNYIVKNFQNNDIITLEELSTLMTNQHAKKLVRDCLWFEARNGTTLKPSFEYICLKLRELGYITKKPKNINELLIGYHAYLTTETVKAYQNFMGIYDANDNLVAILKGKFFSKAEFPRRCKEESFTGITIQNNFKNGVFTKRHNLPIIMFIDMAIDFTPPEYSLKRLAYFGWTIAFNENEVIKAINNA